MKFLVFSDTHGEFKQAVDITKNYNDISAIFHLGDCSSDAIKIQNNIIIPVIYVNGNCDYTHTPINHKIYETPYGNILLTHGHEEKVKNTYDLISYKAESLDCFAVLFGHTHFPINIELGGVKLMNPGSLSKPLLNNKPSYGILTINKENIHFEIKFVEPRVNKKNIKLSISKSLNYSDRF